MIVENEVVDPVLENSALGSEKRPAPAQEKSANKISSMEKQMNGLLVVENSGLCTPEIRKLEEELETEKKRLKGLELAQERQRKFRKIQQKKMKELYEKIPEAKQILKVKDDPGRPRLEDDQPDLLKVICSIATLGSGAHLRRRDETLRVCRTLDDLHNQLLDFGYNLSRSATYLRLLPRFSNSHEGRRHVKTVPVRLVKAQTSEHKSHEDTDFCNSSIRMLNCLAPFLGNFLCLICHSLRKNAKTLR